MRLASFAVALLSAATAMAGPCGFYPGTNVTNNFIYGKFAMKVYDQVTATTSPLNLVVVGKQAGGRTWQILSTEKGPNEGFSQYTMDNYIINGIPAASSIPAVRSVGTLNPPSILDPNATAGQGPWFVFSEKPTSNTTDGFCSSPQGTTTTGLLIYLKTPIIYLCKSSFGGYNTTALVYKPVSPPTGPNVLDPASCHKANLYAYPV